MLGTTLTIYGLADNIVMCYFICFNARASSTYPRIFTVPNTATSELKTSEAENSLLLPFGDKVKFVMAN